MVSQNHNKLSKIFIYLKFIRTALLIAFSGMMGVLIISAIALAIRLSYGPIDLNFAKSKIKKVLYSQQLRTDYEALSLMWDSKHHRLYVEAKELKLIEKGASDSTCTFPEVELHFNLTQLITANFIPAVIKLHKPSLSIYRYPEGNFSIKSSKCHHDNVPPKPVNLNDFKNLLSSIQSIEISEGAFDFIEVAEKKTIHIPEANLILTRKNNSLFLETNAALPLCNVQIHSQIDLQPTFSNFETIQVKMAIKTDEFPYENLQNAWPEKVLPQVRQWLITNLSKGKVIKTNTVLDLGVKFLKNRTTDYSLNDIQGTIDFKDMTLNYLDGAPLINRINGQAKFNKSMFDIDIFTAVSNNIKVTKGNVKILAMEKADQTIEISTLQEGSIKDAIAIINCKPLSLLNDVGMKLNVTKGNAKTNLFLSFPAENTFDATKLIYRVDSQIKDLSLQNILNTKEYKINLTDSALTLKVDNQRVNIVGKGKINGGAAKFSIDELIKPDAAAKFQGKYLINMPVNERVIENFKLPKFLTGPAALKIDYTKMNDKQAMLKIDGDMRQSQLQIPGLLMLKKSHANCQGVVKLELVNNRIKKVHELKINGDGIALNMKAQVSKNGQAINTLACTNLSLGRTRLSLAIKRAASNGYKIDIKGPVLDLEPMINYESKEEAIKSGVPLEISLNCDKVLVGDDKFVKNLKGSLTTHQGAMSHAALKAEINGKKTGQTGNVAIDINTKGDNSELTLNSDNGGEVLRLLNFYSSAKRGKLTIHATKNKAGPWTGKFKLTRFYLENAPGITRLISTGFGLFEGLHNSVKFDKFLVKFKFDKGHVYLKDGKASGPSLGFSINGSLDRITKTLKLDGAVFPYNIINMVLLKIPLIGQLLGGDTGGIWGVSYSAAGHFDHPEVSFNPLSALTPGFLRNIFNPEDEYGEDLQDDAGDDED